MADKAISDTVSEKCTDEITETPYQRAGYQQVQTTQAVFPTIFIKTARPFQRVLLDIIGKVAIEIMIMISTPVFEFATVFDNLAGGQKYADNNHQRS